MIKTDYKTKLSDKPIFSTSRKRSVIPVAMMIILALFLVIWGLSNNDSSTKVPTDTSITAPPINPPIENSELNQLQLEFQHDGKADTNNSATKKDSAKKKQKNPTQAQIEEQFQWKKSTIRSGDSMARVFQRLGFSPTDLHSIISLGKRTAILKNIKPGKHFLYSKNTDNKLTAIRYSINKLKTLTVVKNENSWTAKVETKKPEIRQATARGEINSSLFIAGKNAGLTDSMVMELAGIFGWDIDFILDIREGDQFTVIYEEKFLEGEKIGNGNILAAEFINQNKSFKAIRYTDSKNHSEYYTPAGLSMRKAFLRAPVDFSYISSRFNPRRYHPILKRVKAHRGVDYRAPKGTPVKAAGDGKIIVSAYSKYNGHHVFIQHGQKYVTKYLHFTKRKVKRGQRVKQGQIIGYVGATGLAEAPHLHYEFLVNGVHRNPRTIKLPDAAPIDSKEKSQFIIQTKSLVRQLVDQQQLYDDKNRIAD